MSFHPKAPIEDRFWAKVVKTEGCWRWTGAKHEFGYGLIGAGVGNKVKRAHRLSWEIHCGLIPEGSQVLHRCDNPECSRPDHLFLGTQKDNIRDAMKKGRFSAPPVFFGMSNKASKLTPEAIVEIRRVGHPPRAYGTVAGLQRKFGVSKHTIKRVLSGDSWKCVA